MRIALSRLGYRLAWWLLNLLAPLHHGRGRGVKAVLSNEGRVLLVQHTYGTKLWELPGGGLHRGEEPLEGVRREIREELAVELGDAELIAYGCGSRRHHRRAVSIFAAEVGADAVSADPVEIERAQWYRPDALPPRLGWQVADALTAWARHGAGPVELSIGEGR